MFGVVALALNPSVLEMKQEDPKASLGLKHMRAFRSGKDLNFILNKLESPIPEHGISQSLFCKDDFLYYVY